MNKLELATPRWALPLFKPARYKGAHGGRGCVHPDTLIDTPSGQVKVSGFNGGDVCSWHNGKRVLAQATPAFPCTVEDLYEVVLDDGRSIIVTDEHKFLTPDGWRMLAELSLKHSVFVHRVGSDEIGDEFIASNVRLIRHHSRQTYWDLHVYGTNNYLSNGIVNHNSGKSHLFGEMLIEQQIAEPNESAVCVREIQKSLDQSVKRLLENKIQQMNAGWYFEVQENKIKSTQGTGLIIFQGMQNHTADSIKSLEGYKTAWVEEAQSLSQRSLDLLRPTIRKPGSELWFTWNPREATDPVDALLRGETPPSNSVILQVNYTDNPWFPDVLRDEMEYDKRRDPDKYAHVWLGEYSRNSEARVFKNWRIEEFDAPSDAVHRLGADWGFSIDPTTLIRSHIVGRTLYIDYEAYQVGCDIVDIPALFMSVPDAEKWPMTADSARPETIAHLRKHGFPRIHPAVKGARSLEEGVEWLKSFDIVVHPRCVHTIDELTLYSYKVDPLTGKVLPVLADKDNHVIDALRYAHEGARRAQASKAPTIAIPMPSLSHW